MARRKPAKKRRVKPRKKQKFALVFGTKGKPKLGKSRFSSKKSLLASAAKSKKKPLGFTKV